jgi:tRNA pseudouridine32 synthase/23S rRNA pseudouridine746 synthase
LAIGGFIDFDTFAVILVVSGLFSFKCFMEEKARKSENCFTLFNASVDSFALPEKFTFPFYYEPHTLCEIAAGELQEFIQTQKDWQWDFFNEQGLKGICMGKMFGVLVVKNKEDELGYLSAFSGKLAGSNHLPGFVPPVFDMLSENSFYHKDMEELNVINLKIKQLENSKELSELLQELELQKKESLEQITLKNQELKIAKKLRKDRRDNARIQLNPEDFNELDQTLIKESLKGKNELKVLSRGWKKRLDKLQFQFDVINEQIHQLKVDRKAKSAELQEALFNQYRFLSKDGEKKGLIEIFKETNQKRPPAAAGECAAPKLLQYAFLNGMKPIAMAEFWWGQSPETEIRKHGNFYPACRGKCEPILGHMLKGIEIDENPMLKSPEFNKSIEIVYEDDAMAAINKPEEFLSVPGKNVQNSVLERMKRRFPEATGPLVVHRLDMATSGLMLIAKTTEAYKRLQGQFIKRRVKKTYVALLEGIIEEDEGTIDLPLRVDLDDRPRQLVCYEHGKPAKTKWKVIAREQGRTRVLFFPVTGRTHQLRVHAAHSLGLKTPIVGDDLYGNKANRLHLHAQSIEFFHPTTNEWMKIEVKPGF